MRSFTALSATFAVASATGILLPLYVYPSAVFNDGAANWQPVLSAISAHTSVNWQGVINPADGPGVGPGNGDINYQSGVTQLNAKSNVRTIGYVPTTYGNRAKTAVESDITAWAGWNSTFSVHGIFLDEVTTATNPANVTYLTDIVAFAKTALGSSAPVICNFGTTAPATYYGICDELIVFENALSAYADTTTISTNIPDSTKAGQAAIIVHSFTGTGATLTSLNGYAHNLKAAAVGWAYFCSAGYDSVTSGVATVGNVGDAIYSA